MPWPPPESLAESTDSAAFPGAGQGIQPRTSHPSELINGLLGVTAFLWFRDPAARSSTARSIIAGHALGLASGGVALTVTGAVHLPDALSGEFTLAHALGSALAIVLTALSTEGLRCPHPPAAATTLVVSLGLMRGPLHMAAFGGGVLVTTAACLLLGRLAAPRRRDLAVPTN